MNWKENREQQRTIKEIEREEEIRLQKKEKEQLNKEWLTLINNGTIF